MLWGHGLPVPRGWPASERLPAFTVLFVGKGLPTYSRSLVRPGETSGRSLAGMGSPVSS